MRRLKIGHVIMVTLAVCLLMFPLAGCAKKPPPAEKPVPKALSFEAAEYANAELGFSVKYPKEWAEQPITEPTPTVFYAAAPKRVPIFIVSIVTGVTFADALNAAVSGAGGAEVSIKSEGETKLADGTKAYQAVYKFKHPAAPMALDAYSLGAMKANKWIVVTVATVGLLEKFDEALFSEIGHTLQFKK